MAHERSLGEYEALSFDCYGTLIDWEAGLAAQLVPWAQRNDLPLDREALLELYADVEADLEADHPTDLYPKVLADGLRRLGDEVGVEVTDADADAIARSVADWPAFPDSPEALQRLAQRYRLIIVSNVDNTSFAASNERLGVHFTSVLTAEDLGSYKPAPRNFEALLAEAARLGVSEGGLLHVAQSLFHDHVPGQRAGLRTVWIDRYGDRAGTGATPAVADVEPDWTFRTLAEFADAALGT